MSGSIANCKRCGKEFSGPACPFCTVTGVDLEALLSAEEMKLLREEDPGAPVSLVDMVSGKAIAVVAPLCKIGRDLANDIPLAGDRSMSRFHFQIRQTGHDYYIEDCGSRNGTFLNGSPIAMPRKLINGDIVSAGISRYRFSIQEESALTTSPEDDSGAQLSSQEILEAREALHKLRGTVEGQAEAEPVQSENSAETVDGMHGFKPGSFNEQQPSKSKPATEMERQGQPKYEAYEPGSALNSEPVLKALTPLGPIDQSSPPAWLDEYLFPEVQKLMSEKERLNGLVEEIRQDIKQIDRKIVSAQGISQALLSASGPELGQASKQVFDTLDWFSELASHNPYEMNLKKAPKIEAVVRVVVCQGDPSTKDFEALVNQQAVVWCQSNYEPKGIMVVQVRPEVPPSQRPQLGREFLESMRRKKICVVTPTQLLAIYRLVVLSGHEKGYFTELFMTTCGPLPGFMMKPQDNRAATA